MSALVESSETDMIGNQVVLKSGEILETSRGKYRVKKNITASMMKDMDYSEDETELIKRI